LETDGKDLHVIKNSYDTYIPPLVSQKVDCKSRVCKNTPGHSRIVLLIEHVMDCADALMFCMHMNELKDTCPLSEYSQDKKMSLTPSQTT